MTGGWLDGALNRFLTRRSLMRGAGGVAAGFAGFATQPGLLRAAAQERPEIQAIIDAAATLEALQVTYAGVVRHRASPAFQVNNVPLLNLGSGAGEVRYLRAAQCEEEAHYHFLEAEGAVAASKTFTFEDELFQSRDTALRTLFDLEETEGGLYLAAAREFAAMGDLRLVEIAHQIGSVEGGHRALLKELIDQYPPHDRAFAKSRFPDVAAAAKVVESTGFIGGGEQAPTYILGADPTTGFPGRPFQPGPYYNFPGPEDRFCQGVMGLIPETTEDS